MIEGGFVGSVLGKPGFVLSKTCIVLLHGTVIGGFSGLVFRKASLVGGRIKKRSGGFKLFPRGGKLRLPGIKTCLSGIEFGFDRIKLRPGGFELGGAGIQFRFGGRKLPVGFLQLLCGGDELVVGGVQLLFGGCEPGLRIQKFPFALGKLVFGVV